MSRGQIIPSHSLKLLGYPQLSNGGKNSMRAYEGVYTQPGTAPASKGMCVLALNLLAIVEMVEKQTKDQLNGPKV